MLEPTAALGLSLAVCIAWLIASLAFATVAFYLALVTWPAIRERLRRDPNQHWRKGMNPDATERLRRILEEEKDSPGE